MMADFPVVAALEKTRRSANRDGLRCADIFRGDSACLRLDLPRCITNALAMKLNSHQP
jgi:hypothetical protein